MCDWLALRPGTPPCVFRALGPLASLLRDPFRPKPLIKCPTAARQHRRLSIYSYDTITGLDDRQHCVFDYV